MAPHLPPDSSSSKNPQSKRAIFGSYLNQLTDIANLNNLRQIQATYDPRQAPETLKLQLLIKAQKSLVIDAETLGRDSHMVSKQLYLWACEQPDLALKDVGDRLAYMNYQVGDLQQQCSKTLENSRLELKEIRNLEHELIKVRDQERALQAQINRLNQDNRHKAELADKIASTTAEHSNVLAKLKQIQATIPYQRRRLLKSSYHTQFQGLREMADKLLIISQYGDMLLDELDQDPQFEYSGQNHTAWIKGAACQSLAEYKGPVFPKLNIPSTPSQIDQGFPTSTGTSLHRTDTRLFGETHHHLLTDSVNEMNNGKTTDSASLVSRPSPTFSNTQSHPPASSAPLSSSTHDFINHQAAIVPPSQAPKLPARPTEKGDHNYSAQSQSPSSLNMHSSMMKKDDYQASQTSNPSPFQPTVAEVGAQIPAGTNGPSHGSLSPHHLHPEHYNPDEPPAYTPAP